MVKKIAAGNWKMNGTGAELAEVSALTAVIGTPDCDVLICPPATLISRMADAASGSSVSVGGQDCHAAPSGAHTGDISAAMLKDAGATYVILGHSERRTDHGETDASVRIKSEAVLGQDLDAIICIGETLEEREAGKTLAVVGTQLAGSVPDTATSAKVIVAYEPVWAIGTGLTPTLAQIGEVHDALRTSLVERFGPDGAEIALLYGGSVKPSNAAEIFSITNVNGALVGGASLKATDFSAIVAALSAA